MSMCVDEFGINAVLGNKWSASKMAMAAAGRSMVTCRARGGCVRRLQQ